MRMASGVERALAVVGACVVAGYVALGAQSGTGTLKLLGGRAGAEGKSCGVAPHWTYYRVGGIVKFVGRAGAPLTSVHLVIWRCYASGFRIVETVPAHVTSTGAFKGSFAVNVHSDCFAQAASDGWRSNRAYFRVR